MYRWQYRPNGYEYATGTSYGKNGQWNEVQYFWRIKDQLDVTCYFISLLMCSTCFGH